MGSERLWNAATQKEWDEEGFALLNPVTPTWDRKDPIRGYVLGRQVSPPTGENGAPFYVLQLTEPYGATSAGELMCVWEGPGMALGQKLVAIYSSGATPGAVIPMVVFEVIFVPEEHRAAPPHIVQATRIYARRIDPMKLGQGAPRIGPPPATFIEPAPSETAKPASESAAQKTGKVKTDKRTTTTATPKNGV